MKRAIYPFASSAPQSVNTITINMTINDNNDPIPFNFFSVTSTYKEPLPGWIDNVYGPTGMAVGAGCGVVRVITADVSIEANMVPVDLTVNAILATAKETYEKFR